MSQKRIPPTYNKDSVARMEEKKLRRQRQRRNKKIALSVFVCALCLFSFLLGRVTAPKGSKNGEKGGGSVASSARTISQPDRIQAEGTQPAGSETVSEEQMIAYVEAHPEEYPEHLRNFLKGNPEAAEFVFHYPEYKDREQEIDISGECTKGETPLFIQWDKRWGYEEYGDDLLALSGCGPVCLSMVYVGLTGDTAMDPKAMAEFSAENGYYLENVGTSWDLMSAGAEALGLSWHNPVLSRSAIFGELDAGRVLICSMRPGDFTQTGHFIVIYGREGNDLLIHDPNSKIRSNKKWNYDEVEGQIKNVWSYSARGERRQNYNIFQIGG